MKNIIFTQHEKKVIKLLCIGTSLEYFDLMLYIHMSSVLAELFFPYAQNSYAHQLNTNFTLCMTYLFRPMGAVVFGYIGDKIGRKNVIVITTFMMAASCFVMSIAPTYNSIGIGASVLMILCRALQGIFSFSELTGGLLYITELIPAPKSYRATSCLSISYALGSAASIATAGIAIKLSPEYGWRIAFFIGTIIGVIGSSARSTLKETPDFINAQKRINAYLETTGQLLRQANPILREKIDIKTLAANLFLHMPWPMCFFFIYAYCPVILRTSGISTADIINHNFIIGVAVFINSIFLTYIALYVNPIRILKIKLCFFLSFILLIPYILNSSVSQYSIMFVQLIVGLTAPITTPAEPIFLKHLPILRRFRIYSLCASAAKAFMYTIPTFLWCYFAKESNHWIITITLGIAGLAYLWSVNHFSKLEKQQNQTS